MANSERSSIALQLQVLAAIAMTPLPFFYFPDLTPFPEQQVREFVYDFCWLGGWELANWIFPWSVEEPESLFDSIHLHYYLVLPICGTAAFFLKLCLLLLAGHAVVWSLKSLQQAHSPTP